VPSERIVALKFTVARNLGPDVPALLPPLLWFILLRAVLHDPLLEILCQATYSYITSLSTKACRRVVYSFEMLLYLPLKVANSSSMAGIAGLLAQKTDGLDKWLQYHYVDLGYSVD